MEKIYRTLWTLRLAGTKFVRRQLLKRGMALVSINGHKSRIKMIQRIMRESKLGMNGCEAYQIVAMVKAAVEKLDGELAEVGVSRGGSARLICEVKGRRTLHLFDTFAGLPRPGYDDANTVFWEGQFASNLEEVRSYLKGYSNVCFYKGLFPETATAIADRKFCFVHLDVDLYQATRAGLEFFYPRMVRGGILISHDYDSAGVRAAVDEYFADKEELVLLQPAGSHCFVVKT
jgi:hypothetical protein